MGVEAVIATQVIDTTSVGRSLMTAADAAAARTALSLGTLATQSGTISDYLTTVTAAATYQTILVSGTSIKTVNGSSLLGSGDLTVSGLSGTGSVDNAALRADGTGGTTLQNSSWIINDNLTASPNNTVNHACLEATGGTTNVSVSIKPKGTGAFCLAAPDGTPTGGNARGANAVDLQTLRSAANQVASGTYSIVIGVNCRAVGQSDIAIGNGATASGAGNCVVVGLNASASSSESIAIGYVAATSGLRSIGIGAQVSASGTDATAIGRYATATAEGAASFGYIANATAAKAVAIGNRCSADRHGMLAVGATEFQAFTSGTAQKVCFTPSIKTTSTTPVTMMLDGSSARLTIPSGRILFATVLVCGIKSDGASAACFLRKVAIKNVAGTTSLVGSVETIGTDIEDSPSVTDVSITADNTNDALSIVVTGEATWRWLSVVEGLEIAYGT